MEAKTLDPMLRSREGIARSVIICSGIGLAVVSIAVIWLSQLSGDADGAKESRMAVFNALVPLLGTWVGTVLAFYFSRENFVTAAAATERLIGQAGDRKLAQIPVRNEMTPRQSIKAVVLTDDDETKVLVAELVNMLKPPVTRIPVLTATDCVKYVLHESTIYKFVAMRGGQSGTSTATLKDLLDHDDVRQLAQRFAFVALDATLADAQTALKAVPSRQDVFVTDSGSATEPVRGWITNAGLAKHARLARGIGG